MPFGNIIDIRNNTVNDVIVKDLGVAIPGNVDVNDTQVFRLTDSASLDRISFSEDLEILINDGTLSVNGVGGNGDGTATANLAITDAKEEISVATVSSQLSIKYGESAYEASTTGTSYVQHLRLNFDANSAEYLVQWFAEVRSDHSAAHAKIKVELNDTVVVDSAEWQPSSMLKTAAEQAFFPINGFQKIQVSTGNHSVDLDFASSKSGRTVTVRKTRLSVTKL